ncbi:MAG: glutamine--tRNA ligase, partial [Acidobacteriota bacterium]
PKATLHWVSAAHAARAEVRLYDRLFKNPDPDDFPEGQDYRVNLNPKSLVTLPECFVEPSLAAALPGERFQFERIGYFCADPDSRPGAPVFNRTVTLKDAWGRLQAREKAGKGK